jgi:hypothetical protein
MQIQDKGEENAEELLEYESDDDQFESVYIESQLKAQNENETDTKTMIAGEISQLEVNEVDDDGFDDEYEEEDLVGHDENFDNVHEEEDHFEKQFEDDFRKELENGDDSETKFEDVNEEFQGEDEEDEVDSEDNNNKLDNVHYEETSSTDILKTVTTEVVDDFSESEDEHTGAGNISEVANPPTDDAKDTADRTMIELEQIPVYLDFCDLLSTSNNIATPGLASACLSHEIGEISFDFLKLFVPRCKEDELYFEFDSIYQSLRDCYYLTFSAIFRKLSELMNVHLEKVNIHMTFSDLHDLTIDSESNYSETLALSTILESYVELRKQSPNADLHRFLSVRISCTRTTKEQIRILNEASFSGYRLENLGEYFTSGSRKRGSEHEFVEKAENDSKRVKLDR